MPIAELITEKEDSATTKNFIKKQHQSNRVHCNSKLDLKPEYNKIMRELGFDPTNTCTFHLSIIISMKNLEKN